MAMDKICLVLFGLAMVQGLNKTIGFPSYNDPPDPVCKVFKGSDGPWGQIGNTKTPVVGEYRSLMSVTALNPSQ